MRRSFYHLALIGLLAAGPAQAQPQATAATQGLLDSARYWVEQRRDDLAVRAVDKILLSEPTHPEALLLKGQLKLRGLNPRSCSEVATQLALAHPDSIASRQLDAECRAATLERLNLAKARRLAEIGEYAAAASLLDSIFQQPPPRGALAEEYFSITSEVPERWAATTQGLRALFALQPDNQAVGEALAGHLLRRRGQAQQAVNVVKTLPTENTALLQDALADWRSEIRAMPPSTRRTQTLRRYLRVDPEQRDMLALLQKPSKPSADKTPPGPDYRRLARTALEQGQRERAQQYLTAGLGQTPDNAWIRHDLARMMIDADQPKEASNLMIQGLRLAPRDPDMQFAAALIFDSLDMPHNSVNALIGIAPTQRSESMLSLWRRIRMTECRDKSRQPSHNSSYRNDLYAVLSECEALVADDPALAGDAIDAWYRAGFPQQAMNLATRRATAAQASIDDWLNLAQLQQQLGYNEDTSGSVDLVLAHASLTAQQQQRLTALQQARLKSTRASASGAPAVRAWQLSAAADASNKSGSDGRSAMQRWSVPIQLTRYADQDQTWALHLDLESLDAGVLPNDYSEAVEFGQFAAAGPDSVELIPAGHEQSPRGVAVGLSWDTGPWTLDLGTTPLGFPVVDWVGGIRYSSGSASGYHTLELSRRAITSTVLSYAGAEDPVSGRTWGGVRENGLGFRIGRNRGPWSGYFTLGAYVQTARHMPRNRFYRGGAGIDRLLLDHPALSVELGLGLSYWRHDDNLRYYTYGHGGYYSPQRRLALSLPLSLTGLRGRWSYQLQADISRTDVFEDNALFYPGHAQLQQQAQAQAEPPPGYDAPIYDDGGDGGGWGYSVAASLEYQTSARQVIGLRLAIDRSAFYEPNFATLYWRRSFGRNEPLQRPPAPQGRYAKF